MKAPDRTILPAVSGVLLDIEGTVSPIAFVAGKLFPFARRELPAYLERHWHEPEVQRALQQVALDAGATSLGAMSEGRPEDDVRRQIVAILGNWMDADRKLTGLKELQGLVWRAGYESGELRAPLFPDVAPALARWRASGIDLRVYSSGSVAAQKLFFQYTEEADLRPLLSGYYDTNIGPKRDAESYAKIASHWQLPRQEVVFLSDVEAEIAAANAAGLRVGLVVRPGNAPAPGSFPYPIIQRFDRLDLWPPGAA